MPIYARCPYHHSGGDGYTSTAVCVGHDVAETDAQERDGDEPHGVEEICVLLIMVPVMAKRRSDYFGEQALLRGDGTSSRSVSQIPVLNISLSVD